MTSGEWLIQAHVCRPPMTQDSQRPFGSAGDLWKCRCGQHWMVSWYQDGRAAFWVEVTAELAQEVLAQHAAGQRRL